jgi:hypothetical protein
VLFQWLLLIILFDHHKRFLLFPLVPSQCPRNRIEPIGRGLVRTNSREGVFRRRDFDMVSLCDSSALSIHDVRGRRTKLTLEFDSATAVETCPGGTSGVVRNTYTKFHTIRQEHWAERKGMRADGRDEQSWNLGMYKGSTGRERVCRGTSRSRYSQAISLDRGQVVLVT